MTGAEFNTAVYDLLGTEGQRRGVATLRAAFIKAAVSNLANYIEEYRDVAVANDSAPTPFDTETAEAVAEFTLSKLAGRIDREPQLSQIHMAAFTDLRRRLFLRIKDQRYPDLRPFVGKPFVLNLTITRNLMPMPILGELWFAVKLSHNAADAIIYKTRALGLDVTDETNGKATLVLTAEDTSRLSARETYFWQVQAEDEMCHAVIPDNLSGTLSPRQPVIHSNP